MNTQVNKDYKTLQAHFALKGHVLRAHYIEDDTEPTYFVSKWGQSRSFANLEEVGHFLTQIGGNDVV